MRKSNFCSCANKGVRHLRGDRAADLRLCFQSIDNTIHLVYTNFKPSSFFCSRTARCVSDLVGNRVARFSHDATHLSDKCNPNVKTP